MVEKIGNQPDIPGILLLGGSGSRLHPLTDSVNKHLLPIYDKPMGLHSLQLLEKSGIHKIVVVSNPNDIDLFAKLFEKNKNPETKIFYTIQDIPLGTAHAISLGKRYISEDSFFGLWGDNIFEFNLESSVKSPLEGQARLHITRVNNPQDFGVVEINDNQIISIEDKPQQPKSNIVCTGFMGFKSEVFEMIDKIQLNNKGEYDIMEVIRKIHSLDLLEYSFIKGSWLDAGVSFNTLLKASLFAKKNNLNK